MRLPAAALALILALRPAYAQFEIAKTGVRPRVGLHLGIPSILSVGVGVALVTQAEKLDWREYFLMVEPGSAAGKLLIGIGDWHRDEDPRLGPGVGYMARATFLRRWNANVNYAGVELSMPVVGYRLGVFKPISGSTGEKVRVTAELFVGW